MGRGRTATCSEQHLHQAAAEAFDAIVFRAAGDGALQADGSGSWEAAEAFPDVSTWRLGKQACMAAGDAWP